MHRTTGTQHVSKIEKGGIWYLVHVELYRNTSEMGGRPSAF